MIVLYNPLSDNGKGREHAEKIRDYSDKEEIEFADIREADIPAVLAREDKLVICGGDGTISWLVNNFGEPERDIYYFPAGTGNDFTRDLGKEGLILLNPYIKDLPVADINGKKYKVLNGVGFGIDGYCCEVGDEQRAKSKKNINYAMIAITGLLFHFKPRNASVRVDGKVYHYKKVWIAPTMNGRYYGGGLCVTPDQDRLNPERKITFAVMYGKGRLKTLMVFPKIFKGEHVTHKETFEMISGYDVEVRFDSPTPLQVDGETIKNVSGYHMKSAALLKKNKGKELQAEK